MWRIVCVVFLCFLVGFPVCGQQNSLPDKKVVALFRHAKEAFREGRSEKALELLEKAQAGESAFSALYLLQADIFHKQKKHGDEIRAIERALELDSLKAHPYYFWVLAEFYFNQSDYDRACACYRLYLSRDKGLQQAEAAKKQIKNCEYAVEALRTQEKQPVELFYEAEKPVYWPALDVLGNTLLFTEQDGEQERMWMLRKDVRYPLNFNALGNYGAPSLTSDGRTIYFSMRNGSNGFDIYVAYRLSDTTWSEPVNLGYPVNTESWDAQPAISGDGTKLYFASNREGGRGGSDIWFSCLLRREANGRPVWSQPRCLYFNTDGDEMAPFLYFDNRTLFFASNGYPGMGKKDIYKVDMYEVTQPLNIGITVNSCLEEFGFMVDGSGTCGYFSSDVSGKRCIYRYRLEEQIACPPMACITVRVEDEQGEQVVPEGITFVDVVNGDTLITWMFEAVKEPIMIRVPMSRLMLVNVVKQGFLYYSDTLRVNGTNWQEALTYTTFLKRIRAEERLVLKGIYFDTDDAQLKPASTPELQQLVAFLRLNPEVCIEISGHTDDTGGDQHNKQLSESRAFEVYKYLFLHSIGKDRMSYKGYGKEKPLAPNDQESGRAMNRRTEIKVMGKKGLKNE